MIFIIGTYQHARDVARQGGLGFLEWQLLDQPMKLMGRNEPNVVVLATANEALTAERLHDMMNILFDRSATVWTENDLINGKVPR